MIRFIVCFILLPYLLVAQHPQKVDIQVTPITITPDWQEKTIQVLKKRYQLLGIDMQNYTITPKGNMLKITVTSAVDPVTIKHITYAQGNFRILPIHKFDDEDMKTLFQTFSKGTVKGSSGIDQLTNYLKLNTYTMEEYKFRRYPPAVLGMSSAENMAIINTFLNSPVVQGLKPANTIFCWARKASSLHKDMYDLYLVNIHPETGVYKAEVKDAEVLTKPNHYDRVRDLLYVTYKDEGKEQLKKVTPKNVSREMVAMIDEHVLTAPIVEGPIQTGDLEVEGNFAGKEANLYRRILLDLQLPVPLKMID